MGKPAARVGDMHTCPMFDGKSPHVGGPVMPPGVPTVLIGGMPAATLGNMCTCAGPPDVIAKGSAGVFIGGKPAARMGDSTVHGGVIVAGCPTVLIGEVGGGGNSVTSFTPQSNSSLPSFDVADSPYNKVSSTGFDDDNKLKPNCRYKMNGEHPYEAETDSQGRISSVHAENLKLSKSERKNHDPKTPGKLKGDHAGHLLADRFGGSQYLDNIVSQHGRKVNQSAFARLENAWANALKKIPPNTIEVIITLDYDDDNETRPSKFNVFYSIKDGPTEHVQIENPIPEST